MQWTNVTRERYYSVLLYELTRKTRCTLETTRRVRCSYFNESRGTKEFIESVGGDNSEG